MLRKNTVICLIASAGLCLLILDSPTALQGCSKGIMLCIETVIPSLFPFLWLSGILSNMLAGQHIPGLSSVSTFLGYPDGCASVYISGLLGGYPAGSQAVMLSYKHGSIDKEQAEKLLATANNAGPAFIFGLVSQMFPYRWMAWALWGVLITSSFIQSRILGPVNSSKNMHIPDAATSKYTLESCVQAMLSICGWIIIFRTALEYINKWLPDRIPIGIQTATAGILELSNGCCMLPQINDLRLRFILCSMMLSFGGLCVTMQTYSVAKGLKLRRYIWGKLLQTIISAAISCILMYRSSLLLLGSATAVILFWRKRKNNCRNTAILRV